MTTIYTSTEAIIAAEADGDVVTILRSVNVASLDSTYDNVRLNNFGSIGRDDGSAVRLDGTGVTFTNYVGGLVFVATSFAAVYVGTVAGGSKINNQGDIIHQTGIGVEFNSSALLNNSGSISGNTAITLQAAAVATIQNSGRVEATSSYAVHAKGTSIINLTNSGVVDGVIYTENPNGTDTITNSGRMLKNVNGGGGNDFYTGIGTGYAFRVYGDAGVDRLTGSAAVDTFYGGVGNDLLNGGAGNDLLIGGDHADSMTGGAGIDVFLYNFVSESTNTVRDTIADFVHGQDRINLAAIDANGTAAGSTAFTFIAAEGAAFTTGVRGQVRWDQVDVAGTNDYTFVQADIDGNRTIDFAILLLGLKTLTATDFVL